MTAIDAMTFSCPLGCGVLLLGALDNHLATHGYIRRSPADPEALRATAQAYLDAFDYSSTNGSREAWDARWTALDVLRAALKEPTLREALEAIDGIAAAVALSATLRRRPDEDDWQERDE